MVYYDYPLRAEWELPSVPEIAEEVYLVLELSPTFYTEGESEGLSPDIYHQDVTTVVLKGGEALIFLYQWGYYSPWEHIVVTPDNPWELNIEVTSSDAILTFVHGTFNILTKDGEPSDYIALLLEKYDLSPSGEYELIDVCDCYVTDIYGASASSLSHAYNIRLSVFGMGAGQPMSANQRGTQYKFRVETTFGEVAINQYNIVAYALGMHDHSTSVDPHDHLQEFHSHWVTTYDVLPLPDELRVYLYNQDHTLLYSQAYQITTEDSPDCPPPIEIDITPYINNTDPANNAHYLICECITQRYTVVGIYVRPKIKYTHW